MEIKHFIACIESVRILPREPSRLVLHDIRYTHLLSPGEEFPHFIPKICLFTRFYGAEGTHRFQIDVHWENSQEQHRHLRCIKSPPIEFSAPEPVKDHVFSIFEIRVPDAGLLEFRLTKLDDPETIQVSEYVEVKLT